MTGKHLGYIRISSLDQNTERQLEEMTLDRTFTNKASGKDVQRSEFKGAAQRQTQPCPTVGLHTEGFVIMRAFS
ncbi:hypothetical protein GCM10022631_17680 [Deinococcus rubellus]|uniref:hypothetical protein n=1 Tax=Deinococcus rubellus TaxID=1889240 RepID=UPI0031E9DEB6